MSTKEVIQNLMDAFEKNDDEAILSYMTEEVEWHMVGDDIYSGKEAVQKMFAENPEMKIITFSKDHFIIDGDLASVDGYIECTDKDGESLNMYYCDIYELENGKVKKMISYTIDK